MKRFTILAMFVAMVLSVSAQYKMQVWMNGSALNLPVAVVDSITFLDETPDSPDTPDVPSPDPNPDPSTAGGIGVFSVAEGKTVSFAPGNLQFNATEGSHLRADGTAAKGTWRFAENQYDYIGADNSNVAENYEGWIDLFGWGTSGYDNTTNDSYTMFYQPWSKSNVSLSSIKTDSTLNCDMYEITGDCIWEYTYWNSSYNEYGYGPSTNMQDDGLYGSSANYDWGVYNAISNGGNEAGLWRTLTHSEWSYILESRKNAQFLRSQATVNGVYGYVLLPDDFKKPADITWSHQANSWSTNTYSTEQWAVLEATGAIFLPAADNRSGSNVSSVQDYGGCWSATEYNSGIAGCLHFYSAGASMSYNYRYLGYSVRLVKDL